MPIRSFGKWKVFGITWLAYSLTGGAHAFHFTLIDFKPNGFMGKIDVLVVSILLAPISGLIYLSIPMLLSFAINRAARGAALSIWLWFFTLGALMYALVFLLTEDKDNNYLLQGLVIGLFLPLVTHAIYTKLHGSKKTEDADLSFRVTASDSSSRLAIVLIPIGIFAGLIIFTLSGDGLRGGIIAVIAISIGAAMIIAIGLRTSLVISKAEVTVTKKWFFVPYRRWHAKELNEVRYDSVIGRPDDARYVVVVLDGHEFQIGSRRTAHTLFTALLPLSVNSQTNVSKDTLS